MTKVFSAVAAVLAMTSFAFAETVELVTYYPSSFSGEADRFHAGRATVGAPYSINNPADEDLPNGTLLAAGPVGIGTAFQAAAPNGMLHVVGEGGIADRVLFMPGAGNGSDIRVGIGTEAPEAALHVVSTAADSVNDILLQYAGDSANSGPEFSSRRSRGTPGAPVPVQSGDDLGGLSFLGYNGTDYQVGALISPTVEQDPVAGQPIRASLNFFTTDTTRMTITSEGNVGIGTAAPNAAAALQVDSTTGGFLPPRLTTAQRDAIAAPPAGLLVYNTSTRTVDYHTGASWSPMETAKAWVTFRATGGNIQILSGFNVSNVVRNGPADYTVRFARPFANADYAMVGTCNAGNVFVQYATSDPPTPTECRIQTANGGDGLLIHDPSRVSVIFFGETN